jgi:hypothetical protein
MPYVSEDSLTDVAMERLKGIPAQRLRQIMQSLIKHLHGFGMKKLFCVPILCVALLLALGPACPALAAGNKQSANIIDLVVNLNWIRNRHATLAQSIFGFEAFSISMVTRIRRRDWS